MQDSALKYGIEGHHAPELNVPLWVDGAGNKAEPIKLEDYKGKFKVIYCFQAWCPGCHSRGLPSLQKMVEALKDNDKVAFFAIQTVFEGSDTNTASKLREEQLRYGLQLPFGHDTPPEGERYPTIMEDYRTAGTPWFIVINPDGEVIYNDFRLDADRFIAALEHEDVSFT